MEWVDHNNLLENLVIINTHDNFMNTYRTIVHQHKGKREDYLNTKKKHEELEQEH